MKVTHTPIKAGHILVFDESGEVLYDLKKHTVFEGSYSTKILLKSQGELTEDGKATELYISGNPAKLLQGHNIFGTNDLIGLLRGLIIQISKKGIIDLSSGLQSIPNSRVVRIDITESLRFETQTHVRAYIKQLSQLAHTRNGRPFQKGWTLKFQPGSKRWVLTVYSKGDELQKHLPHPEFKHTDYIQSEADHLCRIELKLLSKELRDLGLQTVNQFTSEKISELYADYVGRIDMSETIEITSDVLNSLPKTVRHTYLAWKSGISVQAEMTVPTFYRHRSQLMKIGVDISVPYQDAPAMNIVPLKRVITAEPYQIPAEAYKLGLVYKGESPKLYAIN